MMISFIIPVYNVAQYLPECVNSILSQKQTDIEILLIDDGSTDGSGALCDSFAAEYDCVRVIHQKNTGAAAARNTGLDHATGEYIAFVDSDDRIAPDSIRKLLNWIQEDDADLCFLEAVRFYPDGRRIPLGENIIREEIRGKDRETVCRHLATRPKYPGAVWAKLFRRSFLQAHQLRFLTDMRHAEDLSFCRDCILLAQSFDILNIPYYDYRQGREGSVTATFAEKGFYNLLQFVADTSEKLTTDGQAKDEVCKSLMSAAAYEYVLLVWMYRKLPEAARKQARESAKQYGWVLGYAPQSMFRLVGILINTVGFGVTSWLLNVYKRSR